MQHLKTIMADMKETLIKKTSHSYLQKYIENPMIDDDRLLLIATLLNEQDITIAEMEDIAVTTMLIQIALDTHEKVSNSKNMIEIDTILKDRQLTVLAGIFYSSLYYKILSDAGNIVMTRYLAQGIKDINEHKILFYQKDYQDIETLMNSLMIIESALLKKLSDHYNANSLYDISSHLLFVKRLLKEKQKFLSDGSSPLFDALKKIISPNTMELSFEQRMNLINICDRYINISKKIIEEGFQNGNLKNEIVQKRWSELLQEQNYIAKTYVEEG